MEGFEWRRVKIWLVGEEQTTGARVGAETPDAFTMEPVSEDSAWTGGLGGDDDSGRILAMC